MRRKQKKCSKCGEFSPADARACEWCDTRFDSGDIFYAPGFVHPRCYDWKTEFAQVAAEIRIKDDPYMEIDGGKVLGLCDYIVELEVEVAKWKKKRK
jgi:hypothetical protein